MTPLPHTSARFGCTSRSAPRSGSSPPAVTPTGCETGARNSALAVALGLAVRGSGLPFKQFDSSTGFRLPDGSVLSPDASLIRLQRWNALTRGEQRSFAPLCPDLAEVWAG